MFSRILFSPGSKGGGGCAKIEKPLRTGHLALKIPRLGPNFDLAENRDLIIQHCAIFYKAKRIESARAQKLPQGALDELDISPLQYVGSTELSLVERVLREIESGGEPLDVVKNVSSLRALLFNVPNVTTCEEHKEVMKYILSSVILKYLGVHKVSPLAIPLIVFAEARKEESLIKDPLILELKVPPSYEDLQYLTYTNGRYFIFYEENSGRCFLMQDMRERDIPGYDVPKLVELSKWEEEEGKAKISVYTKLSLARNEKAAPEHSYLQAFRDRGLDRFFFFGEDGIHSFHEMGHGIGFARICDETWKFFEWNGISLGARINEPLQEN